MKLLQQLCEIHAPSGNEIQLKEFLVNYIKKESHHWITQPEILYGENYQDCLILKFGNPRTALFAHMDTVGFTVRYANQLLPIGSPDAPAGTLLVGQDEWGEIECLLEYDEEHHALYQFGRQIQRGTDLTYKVNFTEDESYVYSAYLDNRLGVYNALKVCETLAHGAICFTCWEEHGGGSVPWIAKLLYENWNIRQALISDITWVTDGVHHGKGVAISMRDRNIPRRKFVNNIIQIAQDHNIPFQLEVEGGGSSDGRELQTSPYPFDWCFVGAPESHAHSPTETVHKSDILAMINFYQKAMKNL